MTQRTIELKPCPFCGGKAELVDDYSDEACWFDLGCEEPYCPAHRVYSGQAVITRDKAIATWNTRAALTAQELPEDEGELWSFMRSTLIQGVDIWHDFQTKGYEEYSARVDSAARERVEKLRAAIAAAEDGAGCP